METFRDRLQAALDERNWGPSDLAAKVTVSHDTIRKWLDGSRAPKLPDAIETARVLGLPLDYLAGNTDATEPATGGLSDDERWVLSTVRELGMPRAKARLLGTVRGIDPDDL